jgi:predicted nucleic acid-binding protein
VSIRPSCTNSLKQSRDALHVAMMERHKVEKIMSFDEGFDGYPGVERVVP